MKHLTAAAALLSLVLPLAACGSEEPAPSSQADVERTTTAEPPAETAAPPVPGVACEPLTPAQEAAVELGKRDSLDLGPDARRVRVGDVNGTPFWAVAATTPSGVGVWTVWGETEADSPQAQALNDVAAEVTVFERASDRFSTPQPVQDAVAECAESA